MPSPTGSSSSGGVIGLGFLWISKVGFSLVNPGGACKTQFELDGLMQSNETRANLMLRFPYFKSSSSVFCVVIASVFLFLPGARADELYPGEIEGQFDRTHNFECIGSFGETIHNFVAQDHYLYLGQGYTLRVLDIADPAKPREVGWLRVAGEIATMDVKGPALYLATDNEGHGLKVIDISDPARPRLHGTLPSENLHLMAHRMGEYLMVEEEGKHGEGYQVYSIRDPLNPELITGGGRQSYHRRPFFTDGIRLVQASGTYVNQDCHQVAIEDLSSSPTTILEFDSPFTLDMGVHFQVLADRVVGTDGYTSFTVPSAEKNHSVWYLTPPLAVKTFCGKWILDDDPGYYDGAFRLAAANEPEKTLLEIKSFDWDSRAVAMTDKVLYAIDNDQKAVQIYDLTGTQPVARGTFPGVVEPQCPIQILGSLAIVNSAQGLKFFDISDPFRPMPCGEYRTYKGVNEVKVSGERAYLLDGEAGLVVLNVSLPEHPQVLARNQQSTDTTILAVQDDLVFLSDHETGFHILDCAIPTAPVPLGSYHGGVGPMSICGNRLYMAQEGLKIFDISNLMSIRLMGQFGQNTSILDLAVAGTRAYLMTAEAFSVFDVNDPANPILLGRLAWSVDEEETYIRESFKLLGSVLYIISVDSCTGNTDCVYEVIDVSDPVNPRLCEKLERPESFEQEVIAPASFPANPCPKSPDWHLSLPYSRHTTGRNSSGLEIYDCSDPLHPRFAGRYDRTSLHWRSDLFNNTIYLADKWGGLLILRHIATNSLRTP